MENKKKSKKGAIIFLVILAVLLVTFLVLNSIDFEALKKKADEKNDQNKKPEQTYAEEMFYPVDYDRDITGIRAYMDKDRYLNYKEGNESFIIDKSNVNGFPDVCKLWYKYFEALKSGDRNALNSLYTEDFKDKFGAQKKFSPQAVYDISVSMVDKAFLENGDSTGKYAGYTVYYYDVSYCIWDNDGTFRRDFIIEDSSRALRFEVLEKDSEVRINNYFAPSVKNIGKTPNKTGPWIWIAAGAVFAVLVVLTVLFLVFIKPKKKKNDFASEGEITVKEE